MEKRSLTLAGHRTSVALEPEFWQAMEQIADHRGQTLAALILEIDGQREAANLASAIRIYVLRQLRGE